MTTLDKIYTHMIDYYAADPIRPPHLRGHVWAGRVGGAGINRPCI